MGTAVSSEVMSVQGVKIDRRMMMIMMIMMDGDCDSDDNQSG